LTEIRNIVKTKQDVKSLWGCKPEKIKILGIDLGQACVVGASALLPKANKVKVSKEPQVPKESILTTCSDDKATPLKSEPMVFHNLAVKQKAVYQPTFKFRRWLEDRKNINPSNGDSSISNLERSLPPLRGESASFDKYVSRLELVNDRLDEFYNGNKLFARRKWDAKRDRENEYHKIADRLLKMIGGNIGRKKGKRNKAVIGIGLGKFGSRCRLSSLHETFASYFISKVGKRFIY
jgi:hypothetical protein